MYEDILRFQFSFKIGAIHGTVHGAKLKVFQENMASAHAYVSQAS